MASVYVVVPAGIHHPARPAAGTSTTDGCAGLADGGWTVHALEAAGAVALAGCCREGRSWEVITVIPDGVPSS